jgi:SAM-dependent methyltransferase
MPTAFQRPFLFAKALYLDRKQRKQIERLEGEALTKVRQLLDAGVPIHLELGHTHVGSEDWLTLDMNLNTDFFWNLRNGIPFPSNSIDVLFAKHQLQQLSGRQVVEALRECLRVLKPGGHFFFSVPDAEPVLRAYVAKQNHFLNSQESTVKPGWLETGSPIDQVAYVAYGNGQVNFMFDRESILHLCQQIGFLPTQFRTPDQNIDGFHREPDTLYVVARKPA